MTSGWGASREMLTNSWRIASALARRHPDHLIYEMHPGGGTYDVLCVGPPQAIQLGRAHVMLNRVGTVQVHDGMAEGVPWPEFGDPRHLQETVLTLERATGWGSPTKTPGATARSLSYRFIARALELLFFDRTAWDARSGFHDSSSGSWVRDFFDDFPSARAELAGLSAGARLVHPASRFWALQRGGEAHLVVSDAGTLHRRDAPPANLTRAYIDEGRRMRRVALAQVADWL